MGSSEIDKLRDRTATNEERADRKRKLILGPKQFRGMRRKVSEMFSGRPMSTLRQCYLSNEKGPAACRPSLLGRGQQHLHTDPVRQSESSSSKILAAG